MLIRDYTISELIRLFIFSNFPSIVKDELAVLQQRTTVRLPAETRITFTLWHTFLGKGFQKEIIINFVKKELPSNTLELKKDFHNLIDSIDNESLLSNFYDLLKRRISGKEGKLWKGLTEKEQE